MLNWLKLKVCKIRIYLQSTFEILIVIKCLPKDGKKLGEGQTLQQYN